MYIYMYVYAYVCLCVCVWMHMYMCMWIYMYMCMCMYMYTYTYTYVSVRVTLRLEWLQKFTGSFFFYKTKYMLHNTSKISTWILIWWIKFFTTHGAWWQLYFAYFFSTDIAPFSNNKIKKYVLDDNINGCIRDLVEDDHG